MTKILRKTNLSLLAALANLHRQKVQKVIRQKPFLALAELVERNEFITNLINECRSEKSRKVLVLSDRLEHLDFLKETRGMAQGGQFGSGMGGFSQEVAEGLTTFVPPSTQQMFIPGQEGKPGLFSVGGAIRGGIGGFMKGGPAGALGGAAMGGFM